MRIAVAFSLISAAVLLTAAPASAQPACGDVLTQDTTLTADLECSDIALRIGAPGITLDLGGHTIYTGAAAILNESHDDVTVRDGVLLGDSGGVLLRDASGNTIRDVTVDATTTGVWLRSSPGNRILSSMFRSASLTIDDGSDGNVVRDNEFIAFEGNLSISGSSDNRIVHNTLSPSRDTPLGLHDAHRNTIRHNEIDTDLGDLLVMIASNDNVIADNTLLHQGPYSRGRGVALATSSRNRFARNHLVGSPLGFSIGSGADNVFVGNTLEGAVVDLADWPDPDGFLVGAAATGSVLRYNAVRGFEDDGIDVEAPGTLLRRNAANDNGDLGIEAVPGVVDGGGNTASGNGNPLQCLYVVCR